MITRKLKRVEFTWDDEMRRLEISDNTASVFLGKVEIFSLARFIVRISAKGFYAKRRKF